MDDGESAYLFMPEPDDPAEGVRGIEDDRGARHKMDGVVQTKAFRIVFRVDTFIGRGCVAIGACAGAVYGGMAVGWQTLLLSLSGTAIGCMLGLVVGFALWFAMRMLLILTFYPRNAHAERQRRQRSLSCIICSTPLALIEPESDGCTSCPECGAAWLLPSRRTPEA
ncbi:MAG: hypothetical protein CMJ31_12475 [Phycisphaerae bacterium]|nr:hypothetical protein [Phycisphaerae bacterium]|tara:strand:+ start:44 stop:544 length:501 start_codon:yes stop_codon:yes gene_type:complete